MPELAEVEHSRRQWDPGLGHRSSRKCSSPARKSASSATRTPRFFVNACPASGCSIPRLAANRCFSSFSGDLWLGIHLGMSGELRREEGPEETPRKHDHLILRQEPIARSSSRTNATSDAFALHQGAEPPVWWNSLAPSVLSKELHLRRHDQIPATPTPHARSRPFLLMQEHFPGGRQLDGRRDSLASQGLIRPHLPGSWTKRRPAKLWEQVRWVSRTAVRIIRRRLDLPARLAVHPPLGGWRPVSPLPHGARPGHRRRQNHLLVPAVPTGHRNARGAACHQGCFKESPG